MVSFDKPVVRLVKNGKRRYIVGSSLPLNNNVSAKISKDKSLTKEILSEIGISTPKGFVTSHLQEAESEFGKINLGFPVVVKPNDSALGHGVTANIESWEEFNNAFKKAKQYSESILIEEHFFGDDHRILVLDGKVVAAARRNLPFVNGDGKSSVKELIERFNEGRLFDEKLRIDKEVERTLKKENLNLNSICRKGQRIGLRWNANVATGGIVEDVTDTISKTFKQIAVKAVKEIGFRFAGVDLMTKDITKDSQEYVLTEINGVPGFDLHFSPTYGKTRDVSELIIKAIFY